MVEEVNLSALRICQMAPATPADIGLLLAHLHDVSSKTSQLLEPNTSQRLVVRHGDRRPSFRSLLEHRIADFLGLDKSAWSILAVSSGTNAIRGALTLVAQQTDAREVIVPAITAASTIDAILMSGFKPVFVDVDGLTWQISRHAADRAVRKSTAAIMTVDWLGTLVSYDYWHSFSQSHSVAWISDSAQALGATEAGKCPYHLPDFTIISTGWPKLMSTLSNGGILIIRRHQFDELRRSPGDLLRHETLPELHAAHGLLQLETLTETIGARRAMLWAYREGCPRMLGQAIDAVESTNGYQATFLVPPDSALTPAALNARLTAAGIGSDLTRSIFLPSLPQFAACTCSGTLKVAHDVATRSISLPIGPHLSLPDIEYVNTEIERAFRRLSAKRRNVPDPVQAPQDPRQVPGTAWSYAINERDPSATRKAFITFPLAGMQQPGFGLPEVIGAVQEKVGKRPGSSSNLRVAATYSDGSILLGQSTEHGLMIAPCSGGTGAETVIIACPDGRLVVRKEGHSDGVDGNGVPWMKRVRRVAQRCSALKVPTCMQLPVKFETSARREVSLSPYIHSRNAADLILWSDNTDTAQGILRGVLDRLHADVWSHSVTCLKRPRIMRDHLSRLRRRVDLAGELSPVAAALRQHKYVVIDGREYPGLDVLIASLYASETFKELEPRTLSWIHGDLNLFNVLVSASTTTTRFDQSVVLVDPRGVIRGDFASDLSKITMSLTGFVAIRREIVSAIDLGGGEFSLINRSPLRAARLSQAHQYLQSLIKSKEFKGCLNEIGVDTANLQERISVNTAINFIADAPCAVGRGRPDEVLPLMLQGIKMLSTALGSTHHRAATVTASEKKETAPQVSRATHSADIIEVCTSHDAAPFVERLVYDMAGQSLPSNLSVYHSHRSYKSISLPCVMIHSLNRPKGQLNSLSAAVMMQQQMFRLHGLQATSGLRTLTIISMGNATRCARLAPLHEKLLMPGAGTVTLLSLVLTSASRLVFPAGGRWVVSNDTIFAAATDVRPSGSSVAVLASDVSPVRRGTGGYILCDELASLRVAREFKEEDSSRDLQPGELYNVGAYYVPEREFAGEPIASARRSIENLDIVHDLLMPIISGVLTSPSALEVAGSTGPLRYRHLGSDEEYTRFLTELYREGIRSPTEAIELLGE